MSKHIRLAFVVLVLGAALLTTAAAAASRTGAVVRLRQRRLGPTLADSHGRTLYIWAHDKHRKSTCYDACAAYWPALTTRGKPRAIAAARQGLLSTTRRRDGRLQVTYHGHPLYRFSGDTKPGQTSGAGLTDFGGRWDPVSAAGLAVRNRPMDINDFKRPKLKRGGAAAAGTPAGDKIALRLKTNEPGSLQVDVGGNGSAHFSFNPTPVANIAVVGLGSGELPRQHVGTAV